MLFSMILLLRHFLQNQQVFERSLVWDGYSLTQSISLFLPLYFFAHIIIFIIFLCREVVMQKFLKNTRLPCFLPQIFLLHLMPILCWKRVVAKFLYSV